MIATFHQLNAYAHIAQIPSSPSKRLSSVLFPNQELRIIIGYQQIPVKACVILLKMYFLSFLVNTRFPWLLYPLRISAIPSCRYYFVLSL